MNEKPATLPAGITLLVLAVVVYGVHHWAAWELGLPMSVVLAVSGICCIVHGLATSR